MDYLEEWMASVESHLEGVSREELEATYLAIADDSHIKLCKQKREGKIMALLQLSRSGFRNHVTVLYADGTHYTIRNAHEIVVDRDINRLFISTKSSKQCNIADGVISVKNNSEMVYIDIGILAGVEVTHAVDDFANKMELKTSFSFMNRGEICGGVLVKNPVSLVLQNDSGTIKNLKDFSDFACFVLNRCEKSL